MKNAVFPIGFIFAIALLVLSDPGIDSVSNASDGRITFSGNQVAMGQYGVHPAFAYCKVSPGGGIISASSNITSVTHSAAGRYAVHVDGGAFSGDIVMTTSDWSLRNTGAKVENGAYSVFIEGVSTGDPADSEFNLIVYRP